MENVSIFYCYLQYFAAIWNNLRPYSVVCGHLVSFPPVLVCFDQEKSGNPGSDQPFPCNTAHTQRQSSVVMTPAKSCSSHFFHLMLIKPIRFPG
jgi:hypothetical protein